MSVDFIPNVKALQLHAGVAADGDFGPVSARALVEKLGLTPVHEPEGWHSVRCSSFADPADVRAFRKCKERGGSDDECFGVGDNGIGKWGDDTTVDVPMCALPPEMWREFGAAARGKKAIVQVNGREVVCELRDTMPHLANITNGAGIDLNPAAVRALGMQPPIMVSGRWRWA